MLGASHQELLSQSQLPKLSRPQVPSSGELQDDNCMSIVTNLILSTCKEGSSGRFFCLPVTVVVDIPNFFVDNNVLLDSLLVCVFPQVESRLHPPVPSRNSLR